MGLKDIFQKQGGMKLIKQYARSKCLGTAISEFVLLGKSRTALEILRLSTQLKSRQRLEKKYRSILDQFDNSYDSFLTHNYSNKVWICWLQGIQNAPPLVQKCFKSSKKNLTDRDIVLITSKNMSDYVKLPEYILKKWKKGAITDTHLTDLLRLELLIKYGGLWLDSTVFCSEKRESIPDYFFNSDLFFYQSLKPGRDGKAIYMSSWLINAKTNNKILMATRNLCYEYWKKNNKLNDYFLLHDFMSIVLERYNKEWEKIVPRDNSTPHILLLKLFEEYNEDIWNSIKAQTPFHKLSYKNIEDNKINTYYQMIMQEKI
ncbi:MAG: capsular polysaccharide synthesis protein [Lachnospiraceae bacterium]|nr:capsular polysaccharide synthesis protein [Lachnospiraceae bacterium]